MAATNQQARPPIQNRVAEDPNAKLLEGMLDRQVEFIPFGGSVGDKLSLTPREVLAFFCQPTKKGFKCSDIQALRFAMLCKARGLNPYEGDAYLVGYDTEDGPVFNMITAHQALLKRAEANPSYDGMQSGVIVLRGASWEVDENGNEAPVGGELIELDGDFYRVGDVPVGGWATVYIKGRTHNPKKTLRLSVYNTGRSRWKTDAAGMIVKCAEADALRTAFPSSLGGLYVEGEHSNQEAQLLESIVEKQSETQTVLKKITKEPEEVELGDPVLYHHRPNPQEPERRTGLSDLQYGETSKQIEAAEESPKTPTPGQRVNEAEAAEIVALTKSLGLLPVAKQLLFCVAGVERSQAITTDKIDRIKSSFKAISGNSKFMDAVQIIGLAKGQLSDDDRKHLAEYVENNLEELGELGASTLKRFMQ